MARLLHFKHTRTDEEYVVIQDPENDDEVEEYARPGFEVRDTARVIDRVDRMPTNRSLVEHC
jgi:hypothetical protein